MERRENSEEAIAEGRHSSRYRLPHGCLHASDKPKLSRCEVPSPSQPSWSTQSNHRHGTLAILFYRMLKWQRQQQLQYLHKKAAQLAFQVVALQQTP